MFGVEITRREDKVMAPRERDSCSKENEFLKNSLSWRMMPYGILKDAAEK